MRAALAVRTIRRCFSTTRSTSAKPLPFEKPIYESEILDNARADQRFRERLQYYGNMLVIAAGVSLIGRCCYYMVYGKEGGAGPMPRRNRPKD